MDAAALAEVPEENDNEAVERFVQTRKRLENYMGMARIRLQDVRKVPKIEKMIVAWFSHSP